MAQCVSNALLCCAHIFTCEACATPGMKTRQKALIFLNPNASTDMSAAMQTTLAAFEESRITTTILVPAQMAAMMASPAWETTDLTHLEYVVVGSSLIPLQQIKNWHSKDVPVSQIYGATETGPTAKGQQ